MNFPVNDDWHELTFGKYGMLICIANMCGLRFYNSTILLIQVTFIYFRLDLL